MNLDEKIDRDSILLAQPPMGGWLKKLRRKVRKFNGKIHKAIIPKKIRSKMHKIEKRNRKKIKKIGAIAAVATAAYFAAPLMAGGGSTILSKVKSMGGNKLAKMAGNRAVKKIVRREIKRKITKQQRVKIAKALRNKRPEDALRDPTINKIAMSVAASTVNKLPEVKRMPAQYRAPVNVLAKEGAFEVQYQFEKRAGNRPPPVPQPKNDDIQKKLMLVGVGLLATKLLG